MRSPFLALAKGIACVCEYEEQGESVEDLPFAEMTLTLVREGKPEKLLVMLKEQGIKISTQCQEFILLRDQ